MDMTEEIHIINWWEESRLCTLDSTSVSLQTYIQTELLEVAEKP